MTTLRQYEANRRNSRKSTGPKPKPLTSGIRGAVLSTEDRAEYDALVALYFSTFRPTRPEERVLIDQLALSDWTLRRLRRTEAELTAFLHQNCFVPETEYPLGQPTAVHFRALSGLQWRLNATRKAGKHALAALRRLRENPIPAAAK